MGPILIWSASLKMGYLDTEKEDGVKIQGPCSQKVKEHRRPPETTDAWNRSSLMDLGRNQLCEHLDLELPARRMNA